MYLCRYNRTRSQRQNYNDVENPPIGSTSEPLGESSTS